MNERQVQQEILAAVGRCALRGADARHVVKHLLGSAAGASIGARIDPGDVIRDLQRFLSMGHEQLAAAATMAVDVHVGLSIDVRGLYIAEVHVAVVAAGDGLQAVEVRACVGVLGDPGSLVDVVATTDPEPLHRLSPADLRDYVHTAVRAFVTHQVDEHLVVDGVRCVDPHPREPNGFDQRLPRPMLVKL